MGNSFTSVGTPFTILDVRRNPQLHLGACATTWHRNRPPDVVVVVRKANTARLPVDCSVKVRCPQYLVAYASVGSFCSDISTRSAVHPVDWNERETLSKCERRTFVITLVALPQPDTCRSSSRRSCCRPVPPAASGSWYRAHSSWESSAIPRRTPHRQQVSSADRSR